MTITLRPEDQVPFKNAIYESWQVGNRHVLGVANTGFGKCHGRDVPILLYNGEIKKVQDVVAGDILMGPDSSPRIVMKTVSGFDNLYKISPVSGDPYTVNSSHILSLKKTAEFKNDSRKGQVVNMPVEDFINSTKRFKHLHKGWRAKINFQSSKSNFDPYMLGVWLGDGTSRLAAITTPDEEIINYCKDFAAENDMKFRLENKTGTDAKTIHLTKHFRSSRKKSYMGEFLSTYGLTQNKHIPHHFKTSSESDRLKLLAGILDTDGYYNGSYDVVFKQERLLDDVIFIARSLGFSAYKSAQHKTCTNTGASDTYYRCCINGDLERIPVLIDRKRATVRKQKKDVLVTGIKVEDAGYGEYFGFEVHGPDHLYVLGDFTVTHNSVVMSDVVVDHHNIGQKCAVMAHRNELVGQMSCHIANRGIPHRVIGSNQTIAQVTRKHRKLYGRSFLNPSAQTAVVGVDTMMARRDSLTDWARQIDCWLGDEHHHCVGNWQVDDNGNPVYKSDGELKWRTDPNKWAKAVSMFTNARGAGFTATPQRADGQGLGWEFDGVYHDMVLGPSMRDLINRNCLSDYEIVCPASDLQTDDLKVSKDGDWSNKTLRKAAKRSHIVGDVVENYVKYAPGRKAIVFATDVETANEIAKNFNENGIRAVSLNGKSDIAYREQSLHEFEHGEIQVLVNVDLFDEGLDVVGAEVCIMARPTASLGKYLQMAGRVLRYLVGKVALIIDHVSNVIRHGLPDKYREWSLGRRDKRAKQMKDPDEIPLTPCKTCRKPYEAFRTACPYCGAEKPLPVGGARSIEQVEGDLILLDRETLERMRAATEMESAADVAHRVRGAAGNGAGKYHADKHIEKIAAHEQLKETMAIWAGYERARGFTDSEIYRRFYMTLGVDMSGALDASQTRAQFESLTERIRSWYEVR